MLGVDIFSGAGGWAVAAEMLGFHVIGIDSDKYAAQTHEAAGHPTIHADVTKLDPEAFSWADIFIASPPCQSFSNAGLGKGLDDPRGQLVFEMWRWIMAIMPAYIAFEQVPQVLPFWEDYAGMLEDYGYSCWTGILHAEQFGVPQTRKRAILIARRDGKKATPPIPTHSKYHIRHPEILDPGVLPFVTMGEAISSDPIVRTRGQRKTQGGNLFDSSSRPALALTEKTRSWIFERPAPIIVGTRRSDEGLIVGRKLPLGEERDSNHGGWTMHGGYRVERKDDSGVRITSEEASLLQTFPADYPWRGARYKQFQQIGNAIPPGLAYSILSTFL